MKHYSFHIIHHTILYHEQYVYYHVTVNKKRTENQIQCVVFLISLSFSRQFTYDKQNLCKIYTNKLIQLIIHQRYRKTHSLWHYFKIKSIGVCNLTISTVIHSISIDNNAHFFSLNVFNIFLS